MSSEGLDIPSLNAIIFTTPKSSIEQSIGRITRQSHKKIPIAYDIVDQMSMFPNQYIRRERVYKKLGYKMKGLENSFEYYKNCLSLPIYTDLSINKQNYIIDCLEEIITN